METFTLRLLHGPSPTAFPLRCKLAPGEIHGIGAFRGVKSSSGPAFIPMMESADCWLCNKPPQLRRFNHSPIRRILPEREMAARAVVIVEVTSNLPSERSLIHHDDVIQTLTLSDP